MNIAAAADMPQSEMDLWAAVRSYLNLEAPLAAVLRRPYRFLRPATSQVQPATKASTVLQFPPQRVQHELRQHDQEQQ
ncbi:hypothetical protein H8Z72_22755 (plasmid) [Xanthomonas citri pv. citri]|uniref:hypothetical protein n=1 Tax=Xanthomonas citri TaxID=346 RepID=UPI001931C40F|nr:hypothetical protein [Xanthomonas citri]QRD62649.1 hypothetical protein H8Z74_23430 [Xanthomonas citri pv. citri]QRD67184.1 hypothetical protein H8Z73_22410 [Xanthomonas citri pv. citri]QRD71771.1 hypothetical protein H8Z72_22755 [Xanthomonas citri pv. citri]